MAFQIIEQLILLTNDGKWKGVNKKKKFREEFATEEEAFNDYFRIGISFNALKNNPGKLSHQRITVFTAYDRNLRLHKIFTALTGVVLASSEILRTREKIKLIVYIEIHK